MAVYTPFWELKRQLPLWNLVINIVCWGHITKNELDLRLCLGFWTFFNQSYRNVFYFCLWIVIIFLKQNYWGMFQVELLQPDTAPMKYAMDQMSDIGFKVKLVTWLCSKVLMFEVLKIIKFWAYFGRWLIDGYPNVVLFDIGSAAWKLDQWKHEVCFFFLLRGGSENTVDDSSIVFSYFSYGSLVKLEFHGTIGKQTMQLYLGFLSLFLSRRFGYIIFVFLLLF